MAAFFFKTYTEKQMFVFIASSGGRGLKIEKLINLLNRRI
jgi:hypothetical protein